VRHVSLSLRAFAIGMAINLTGAAALAAEQNDTALLIQAARQAEESLRQNFTNLSFEDFRPSPIKGPIYQANAGGRILYYAPESEHILFATVYDRAGVNMTALAQEELARRRLAAIDPAKALAIGPSDAPVVIEFTDPDCPYCRALDRFWQTKATEGKPVRRLLYFVSGIHPQAAAKAEHILCSPDPEAAQRALYAGQTPDVLLQCKAGADKDAADAEAVKAMGISGTPTLFLEGKMLSRFTQAEIEAFLAEKRRSQASP